MRPNRGQSCHPCLRNTPSPLPPDWTQGEAGDPERKRRQIGNPAEIPQFDGRSDRPLHPHYFRFCTPCKGSHAEDLPIRRGGRVLWFIITSRGAELFHRVWILVSAIAEVFAGVP